MDMIQLHLGRWPPLPSSVYLNVHPSRKIAISPETTPVMSLRHVFLDEIPSLPFSEVTADLSPFLSTYLNPMRHLKA